MTDITTTSPIAIGSIRTTRSRNPLLVIGQGIGRLMKACSRGLRGLLVAYVRAIELAYLEPYRIHSRKEQAAPDADFEGRDPSWWLP